MTLMLASVRSAAEAELALEGGADLIDLKEPSQGALGALNLRDVASIIEAVGGRKPVSAVTGDLPMEPETIVGAVSQFSQAGLDYIKIGLFPGAKRIDCIRALSGLAAQEKLIGVMFADDGADFGLCEELALRGFHGVMIDTARKGHGRLLDHMSPSDLQRFVTAARQHNLLVGLAGSLEAPDVPRLLPLKPSLLGFRGALCDQLDRRAGLSREAIAVIRGLIPLDCDERPAVLDYGRMRARSYPRDPVAENAAPDKVHVRDLVLPVYIGAYQHEHDRPQRVRFDITAEVRRQSRIDDDMRNVFSYDLIIDGIKRLVASGHIALVETLAERIADDVLQYDQVLKVQVKVEKLDIGPGAVGIEITRVKAAAAADVRELFPTYLEKDPRSQS